MRAALLLRPVGDGPDWAGGLPDGGVPLGANDDFPYAVELIDRTTQEVLRPIAFTLHVSLGYAAFYEAIRTFPDHDVRLACGERVYARSTPRM